MADTIDFEEILKEYRADPFSYVEVKSPHTGLVHFLVSEGATVTAPSGQWNQVAGTPLYEITRERNTKIVTSPINGEISSCLTEQEGAFVDADALLLTIKHPLKKKEIIDRILKKVLTLFPASEQARYFFSLEIQSRMEKSGTQKVSVRPGDEIFTMSLMKRDTQVVYEGEPGILHSVYFQPGESVEQGAPLAGICSEKQLPLIDKIITRVKAEWE